jgi:hypothetical protein
MPIRCIVFSAREGLGYSLVLGLDTLHTPTVDRDSILWPDNRAFFEILDQVMESVRPRTRTIRARTTPSSTRPQTTARGWQPCPDDAHVA